MMINFALSANFIAPFLSKFSSRPGLLALPPLFPLGSSLSPGYWSELIDLKLAMPSVQP